MKIDLIFQSMVSRILKKFSNKICRKLENKIFLVKQFFCRAWWGGGEEHGNKVLKLFSFSNKMEQIRAYLLPFFEVSKILKKISNKSCERLKNEHFLFQLIFCRTWWRGVIAHGVHSPFETNFNFLSLYTYYGKYWKILGIKILQD